MCDNFRSYDCWDRQLGPPVPAPLAHPSEYPFTPLLTLEQQYAPLIHTLEYPFVPLSPIDNQFSQSFDYQAFLQMPLQHSLNTFDNFQSSHSLGQISLDRPSLQQQVVKHYEMLDNPAQSLIQSSYSQIPVDRQSMIQMDHSRSMPLQSQISQVPNNNHTLPAPILQHFTAAELHMEQMLTQSQQQPPQSNHYQDHHSVHNTISSYMPIEHQQRLIDPDFDAQHQIPQTQYDQQVPSFPYSYESYSNQRLTNPYFQSNNLLPYQIPKAHPNKSFDMSQNQNNPLLNSFQQSQQLAQPIMTNNNNNNNNINNNNNVNSNINNINNNNNNNNSNNTNNNNLNTATNLTNSVNNLFTTSTNQFANPLLPFQSQPGGALTANNLFTAPQTQFSNQLVPYQTQAQAQVQVQVQAQVQAQTQAQQAVTNNLFNVPQPAAPSNNFGLPALSNNMFQQPLGLQQPQNAYAATQNQFAPNGFPTLQQQQPQPQTTTNPYSNTFSSYGTATNPFYNAYNNNDQAVVNFNAQSQMEKFTPTFGQQPNFASQFEQMQMAKIGQLSSQYPFNASQNNFNQMMNQTPEPYPTMTQNFQNFGGQFQPPFSSPIQQNYQFNNSNNNQFGQIQSPFNQMFNSFQQQNNINNINNPNNMNNQNNNTNMNNNNFENQLNLAKIVQEYGNAGMQTSFPLLNNLLPNAHPYEKLHLAQALGSHLTFNPINYFNSNFSNHFNSIPHQQQNHNFMNLPQLPLNNQLLPFAHPFEAIVNPFEKLNNHLGTHMISHMMQHKMAAPIHLSLNNQLLPLAHPFERLHLTHPFERLQLAHQIAHQFTNTIGASYAHPLHNHLVPLAHPFERTPFTHSIDRLQLAHHIASNLSVLPNVVSSFHNPHQSFERFVVAAEQFGNNFQMPALPFIAHGTQPNGLQPLANRLLPLAHPYNNIRQFHHHHHHHHVHPPITTSFNHQHLVIHPAPNPIPQLVAQNPPSNFLNQRLIPLAHPFIHKVSPLSLFTNPGRAPSGPLSNRLLPFAHPFVNQAPPSQLNRPFPLPMNRAAPSPLASRLLPFAHPFDTIFGSLQLSQRLATLQNRFNAITLNNRLTYLALGQRIMSSPNIQQLINGSVPFNAANNKLSQLNRFGPFPATNNQANRQMIINNNNNNNNNNNTNLLRILP